ncbi:MAG: small multi-drug export protein [Candidatus Doudnabacteria bacterium]|nr:small multi-drug export protein [Candidatus Doudnabacteria bacterium]MCA9387418.1 small multi-drug export protein [Candidatus Andersenbacteria bacterium]
MIDIASWFSSLPPQLATPLIAMFPIGELRAALPVALTVYDLPIWQAVLLSVFGNMIPVVGLLALYGPLSEWLSKHSTLAKHFFDWLFQATRERHKEKFQKWGAAALILFVAIPIPVTGAWTGSVAAFVFGIPYKHALGYIFLGVCIASVIVTLLTLAGGGLYELFVH